MRVGLFGGSFNPVHEGHLKLAREAVSELNLDKMIFIPSYRTPLKSEAELLPWRLRAEALEAAIGRQPQFEISLCEIKRKGVSYTVDTLKYFRRKMGASAVFYFFVGADSLRSLSRWKSPREVLSLCRFVVASRPGSSAAALPGQAIRFPFDALEVSSTAIRRRLRVRKSLRGFVPAGVERVLIKKGGFEHRIR